jgi:hypothetical protein
MICVGFTALNIFPFIHDWQRDGQTVHLVRDLDIRQLDKTVYIFKKAGKPVAFIHNEHITAKMLPQPNPFIIPGWFYLAVRAKSGESVGKRLAGVSANRIPSNPAAGDSPGVYSDILPDSSSSLHLPTD